MCVRTFASWGAALMWITQDSSHVQLFVCDCVHICLAPWSHKCSTIRDRLPFASTPCSLRCELVGKSSVQVQRDVKCVALSVRHYAGKRTSADTCTSGETAVDQLCAGTHIMQHRHSDINLARQQTHKDKNTLTQTLTQSYTEIKVYMNEIRCIQHCRMCAATQLFPPAHQHPHLPAICPSSTYNGYVAFSFFLSPFFTLVSSKRYDQVHLLHLGYGPAENYRASMNHQDKGE